MKPSLEALPAEKQQQLHAVAEVIRNEAPAEMIILFGSYARGDWVEDPVGGYFSDYDILVIVEKPGAVERQKLWAKVEARAERVALPTTLSLIVHDIKDVNEQLEKGFYFFSDIKREGIMLYDTGRFQLAEAKASTLQERSELAQLWFDEWFQSAADYYGYYEFGLEKGKYKSAAFLLHQATERLFHTVLLVFTAYKPKTHNLELLGKRCADLHAELRYVFPRNSPEDKRIFKLLKSAYIDARYNMKYVVTPDELQVMAGWVRDLRQRVERVCIERIEFMRQGGESQQDGQADEVNTGSPGGT